MRIGVTGNYASGKGTVCSLFEKLGAIVIDTDIISRQLMAPDQEIYQKVVSVFGKDYLNEDATINRRKLGSFVFADKNRIRMLNSIVHPAILEQTLLLSTNSHNIYMINAPLLFEAEFDKYMDLTIVVIASPEQLISRGIFRDGLSSLEIKDRLSHQKSLNEQMGKADYVIDNSGEIDITRKQVNDIWNKIISRIRE
jgi:dephospho-CoA kinase